MMLRTNTDNTTTNDSASMIQMRSTIRTCAPEGHDNKCPLQTHLPTRAVLASLYAHRAGHCSVTWSALLGDPTMTLPYRGPSSPPPTLPFPSEAGTRSRARGVRCPDADDAALASPLPLRLPLAPPCAAGEP